MPFVNQVSAVGVVVAVSRDSQHRFSKPTVDVITVVEGLGVDADAHSGTTVQHRSRARRHPNQPNLRQVHLIHAELHDMLNVRGFAVGPGEMGETITTRGVDLLALPTGTRLHLGEAILEVTGLRNPCRQLNDCRPGLMQAVLERDEQGQLIRLAGVMAVVLQGGGVRTDDGIVVELPEHDQTPLQPV